MLKKLQKSTQISNISVGMKRFEHYVFWSSILVAFKERIAYIIDNINLNKILLLRSIIQEKKSLEETVHS